MLQGHIGLLKAVDTEFISPSETGIGKVIAAATLAGIENAMNESGGGPVWYEDNLKNGFLAAGFEAICDSEARKSEKSIAKRSLRLMERDEFAGEPPMSAMEKLAGSPS